MSISSLIVPGAAGAVSAVLGARSFKSGYHDLGLLFCTGTAISIYFCYYDYKRRSQPDYKTKLVAQRRAEFEEANTPHIVKLLGTLQGQIIPQDDGDIKFVVNPMMQQQLVMREVQTGEMLLGQGDKTKALERFSSAAVLSALSGGTAKGDNLIATVSRMLPNLAAVLQQQYENDYNAARAHLKKAVASQAPAQKSLTREEMIASLKTPQVAPADTLEEDSIDDSDEEKEDIEVPKPAEEKVEAKEEPVVEQAIQQPFEAQVPVVAAAPQVEKVTVVVEKNEENKAEEVVEEEAVVEEVAAEPVAQEPVVEEALVEEAAPVSQDLDEPMSQPEILTDSAFQEPASSVPAKEQTPEMDDEDLE